MATVHCGKMNAAWGRLPSTWAAPELVLKSKEDMNLMPVFLEKTPNAIHMDLRGGSSLPGVG